VGVVIVQEDADTPVAVQDGLGNGTHTVGESPAEPLGSLPLPLSPDLWRKAVFQNTVAPAGLVRALVTDPQAALLYRGLSALDDATLRAIGDAETVEVLHRRHAALFSLVAPSFRIDRDRVAVPGGYDAAVAWQSYVGASILKPAEFLLRLLDRDDGRAALLFDALRRTDEGKERWALGLATAPADPQAVTERLKDLREIHSGAPHLWWLGERGPFSRPPVDLGRVLAAVRLSPEGRFLGPADRAFWEAAFADTPPEPGTVADGPVTAPWLLERLANAPLAVGLRGMDTLRFVQRRFPAVSNDATGDVLAAARGFARYRTLALVLERIGVEDPALYAAASRRAGRLSSVADRARAPAALAQFQGALALLDGARVARVLDRPTAVRLVRELVAVDSTDEGYGRRMAEWLAGRMVPALREATGAPAGDDAEDVVVAALAGVRRGAPAAPRVEWEGLSYVVDVPAADAARIRAVRARQPGDRLGAALTRKSETAVAEALVGLTYAAQLPHPDTPLIGDVASRHDFGERDQEEGSGGLAAWSVPREVSGPEIRWHVHGALLALDVGLAARRLRRAHAEPPGQVPRLNVADRQSFAETAALLQPAALTDEDRDAIAAALSRGRARVRGAASDPYERARLLTAFAGRPLRREEIRRIAETAPGTLGDAFTLGELLALGREGSTASADDALAAWGTPGLRDDATLALRLPRTDAHDDLAGRRGDGRLGATVPDLNLRVAEALAEMRLPARLAPAILAFAVQDLIDEVQPAYLEDAATIARYAREIPKTRLEDYVSSLVGGGPLVPLEGR
jgi:hypothetical protein